MRVDPFFVQGLAGSLNDVTASEAQLSEELSSGLRVTNLSVDPVAAAQGTLLGSAVAADDSYVQAASSAQSKLQLTDSALGEVVTQLTQAISLATSGGDATLNAADKATVGQELSAIRDQVLALANTQYLGQYIFGGSKGSTAPFVQTGEGAGPASTKYVGDSAVQYVTTESGQKIATNLVGSNVFTATGSSVLGALNQVVADFAAGATGAQLVVDTGALTAGLNTVNAQRGLIDTSLTQVEASSTYAQTDATQQSAAVTTLLDANAATVATQLSNAETQSAALSNTIATLEKGSLFDYLK
jgi:flagellar hook-associated protein 3 FlgL